MQKKLGVAASLLAPFAAFATGPDVTAITSAGADIATVGASVFAIYIGIKLVHWIRRAL